MTIDEIRKHPFYKLLGSDQLRKFVDEMCSNGFDKMEAAKVAWGSENEQSQRTQANRALKHKGVAQLIALCQGRPNREEYLIALNARAAMADDDSVAYDFYELIGKVEGWLTKPADNKPPADSPSRDKSLDDLVEELEKKRQQ